MNIKEIKCFLLAIKDWIINDVWIMHEYESDSYEFNKIIISTPNSFRVSNNYTHSLGETVHHNAVLITNKCKCCGKTSQSWCNKYFYDEYIAKGRHNI